MTTQEPTSWDLNSAKAVRKLQFLIDANHVTVLQVAETLEIPQRNLQQVLDGASHPTESLLRKCADYFGVTLEFINGQDPPAPKATEAKPKARGRAQPLPKARTTAAESDAKAGSTLNVRTVATRHQALVELLIEKGLISARDYHELVRNVEGRAR